MLRTNAILKPQTCSSDLAGTALSIHHPFNGAADQPGKEHQQLLFVIVLKLSGQPDACKVALRAIEVFLGDVFETRFNDSVALVLNP
jgi:hypothetical protein